MLGLFMSYIFHFLNFFIMTLSTVHLTAIFHADTNLLVVKGPNGSPILKCYVAVIQETNDRYLFYYSIGHRPFLILIVLKSEIIDFSKLSM